jgi:hypothetical protein
VAVDAAFFDFFLVAVAVVSAVLESAVSVVLVDFFFLVVVPLSAAELSAA